MFNYGTIFNATRLLHLMHSLESRYIAFVFALVLVLGAVPASGWAQDGKKYGFVNVTEVITQSDEGQAEARELQSIGEQKQQELNARKQELDELTRQFQESASDGQPDQELRDRIEKLQRELERDARQAQADVDTSRKDRIQAIGSKVVQLVKQFGQENGYTAIFRVDSGQVVYVDSASNVTDQIITAYNKAYPVD